MRMKFKYISLKEKLFSSQFNLVQLERFLKNKKDEITKLFQSEREIKTIHLSLLDQILAANKV